MKKWLFLNLLLCLIFLSACHQNNYQLHKVDFNGYLDTVGYVIVEYNESTYEKNEIETILEKINNLLLNIEKEFSVQQTTYMQHYKIENSTTMLINERSGTNVKTPVSSDFIKLLKESIEISQKTEGLFDVTIGPLSNLWNISKRSEYCLDDDELLEELCAIPNDSQIQETLALVDYQKIELNEQEKTVYLKEPGMALDFGAIAKGFAVDMMSDYLEKQQLSAFIINIGGNVKTFGTFQSQEEKLKIHVTNPFGEGNVGYYYPNNNTGGVTSGVYERYIISNGKKYHHLLNPFTGYPCDEDIVSVTIMGPISSTSDALSTSIFELGLEKGLELINQMDSYEAIIITKDQKVYLSKNMDFILEDQNLEKIELR